MDSESNKEKRDLNVEIKNILYKSNLSFDETRAFFDGLQYLPDEDKEQFIEILSDDPELIYPLYINFKAKLKALDSEEPEKEWDKIVEDELAELDKYLDKKGINKNDN